jgi:hypothetical protein
VTGVAAMTHELRKAGTSRPKAGVKLAKAHSQATESTTPGLRGEYGGNRKTIAQGMSECFGVPVVTEARVVLFHSHARLWVRQAPGIPCALFHRGTLFLQEPQRESRCGNAEACARGV